MRRAVTTFTFLPAVLCDPSLFGLRWHARQNKRWRFRHYDYEPKITQWALSTNNCSVLYSPSRQITSCEYSLHHLSSTFIFNGIFCWLFADLTSQIFSRDIHRKTNINWAKRPLIHQNVIRASACATKTLSTDLRSRAVLSGSISAASCTFLDRITILQCLLGNQIFYAKHWCGNLHELNLNYYSNCASRRSDWRITAGKHEIGRHGVRFNKKRSHHVDRWLILFMRHREGIKDPIKCNEFEYSSP